MAKDVQTGERRKARVRRTLRARAFGRPRLSVFRSSKQIYAQIIDDENGVTLASASSLEKDNRTALKTGADVEAAKTVGKLIAERAKRLASAPSFLIVVATCFTAESRLWLKVPAKAV